MLVTYVSLLSLLGNALAQNATTLLPQLYKRFPVGAIKPTGWARNQGEVQASGLAGQLRDWFSYVANSIWVPGGTEEYSEMHEAAPYWFNGMVALGYQIDDERITGLVSDFVDHILSTQQDDGWIGPELPVTNGSVPRLVWPRYLILLGLIQYAEAVPAQSDRVITSMHKFLDLVHTIFANNEQGDASMGFQFDYQQVRWEEMLYALQWLYDTDPRGQEAQLIDTMKLVKAAGFDWQHDWFTDATFPKLAVPGPLTNMHTHGVNLGEALKSEAVSWRFTGDPTAIDNTWERIALLYGYHGRASGTFSADEHLAGLDPSRGTETCAVVEQMFSLETIYQTFGNNTIADMVEKLAYNAMPGASLANMWGHVYDQQTNQIWAKNITDGPVPWGVNGPYSGVFGMESNYPCCTVNHPQGSPKLWMHTFLTDQKQEEIIHAFLGPASLSTTLKGSNNKVNILVDTVYPFGSTLKYTVNAVKAFTFNIRIPEYAKNSKQTTISVNGAANKVVSPDAASLQSVSIRPGTTQITLNLDMPLQLETRTNGAIAINRGPLNYVVQVQFNTSTTAGWRNPQALSDAESLFPDTPAVWFEPWDNHTKDYTLLPTSEWRLAIDPSTIVVHDNSANMQTLPLEAWAPNAQPVSMSAKGCQIEWNIVNNAADVPPTSPVTCAGEVVQLKLTPYGGTPLRIGEIPIVKIS